MKRRTFFKTTFAGGAMLAASVAKSREDASITPEQCVTIFDLDRCDGCAGREMPACVAACREDFKGREPEPKHPIGPYWPQKTYEDHSHERDRIDRLTPYNRLYVQQVDLPDGRRVYAPRRCMHCVDAPCRKLCPFGAIDKSREGAVSIDERVCFGGAKCRDVCPWQIPQRQAGVGLYLDIAPKFAGGGVMFKCDMCRARLAKGERPACVGACPKGAVHFGSVDEMSALIEKLSQGRHVWGREENGGTATWYVSSVSFEEMQKALVAKNGGLKHPQGEPDFRSAEPRLEETGGLAVLTLAAPVLAVGGALALRRRKPEEYSQAKAEMTIGEDKS